MTELKEPLFTSQVNDWLSNKDNIPILDDLQKYQAHRDIAIRQAELVSYLSSQKTLRSRVKSIPGFWPWTLSRCKTFSQACTSADDWEAMGHLEDMEFVVDPRDYRAFDIVFHFSENPYFSNKTLTKSYVPTSGPTRGMTASESIGRARPSGISTIPDNIGEAPSSSTSEGDDKKTTGASGEKPGKAPEGEEWVTAEVIEGTSERVKQMIAFFDEMDDLVGLVTEINWKSDEKNLQKLLPREDPEALGSDDGFDAGDRGSFFHFFTEQVDQDGLASLLWQDVLPNCVSYFEGNGADNDSDAEDSMDEEDMSDMDGEIDLVSDEDELEDAKEERPAKRTKTQ